jgi:Copper type II ascorbate-dependent monooxygenase, C-terminal domain
LILLLIACAAPIDSANPSKKDSEAPPDGAVLDQTRDYEASSPGHAVLTTPVFEVAPHSEIMWCTVGTWSGDAVGITDYDFSQALPYGHHAQLMYTRTPASELPDGSIVDCTHGGIDATPLFQGARTGSQMLPDGMALFLAEQTRWIIQSHYINTTDQTLRANDAVFLDYVAEEEVENWGASWNFGDSELELPPGDQEVFFDCAWPVDFHLLSLSPHMHEHGTALWVEQLGAENGAAAEEIYRKDPWDPRYRDDPPVQSFAEGAMSMLAGDRFRVHCAYHNPTEQVLKFPDEMCGVYGLGYSSRDPVNCTIGVGQPMN